MGAKVCDLRLDILQVRAGHDPDLRTRPLALVGKFEKCPHLHDGKAERPGATDEGEAPEVRAMYRRWPAGLLAGVGSNPAFS
jgi:hypothetical protein